MALALRDEFLSRMKARSRREDCCRNFSPITKQRYEAVIEEGEDFKSGPLTFGLISENWCSGAEKVVVG